MKSDIRLPVEQFEATVSRSTVPSPPSYLCEPTTTTTTTTTTASASATASATTTTTTTTATATATATTTTNNNTTTTYNKNNKTDGSDGLVHGLEALGQDPVQRRGCLAAAL